MSDFGVENVYSGFRLIKKEYVDDIKSVCHVFEHEKSGARLFYAKNDDKNKVFFISYKTPPENDFGTAHIMEHSVLCGSEKYPVKDPFNELLKGSLNTYLNALTYSDKTMYPVASINDKDFENLVKVYVDAVFKPNVLNEKKIFMQEGWHYELEGIDKELKYNGIVYNEMKGALSQPESVLMNMSAKSLFGDTVYGYESGGEPEKITDLTYDYFKDFYNKFYYPSNSYIYFYGDMDIEKYFEILSEYLEPFDLDESKIAEIKEVDTAFKSYMEGNYPALSTEENDSYFSLNFCVGKTTDILLRFAMNVICYMLFDTNASPVKKAIVDSGICKYAEGWFDSSAEQMTLNIVGKKCVYERKDEFKNIVLTSLRNIVKNGIDKKLCLSAINYIEFITREADFGYKPKGLAYGTIMMRGWLYGKDPIESLKTFKYFDELRKGIDNGYFESIIENNILNNKHSSFVVIKSKEGLQLEFEKNIQNKLRDYKNSITNEEKENIIKETAELKKYQSEPDNNDDLCKIPFISVDEINKKTDVINVTNTNYGIDILGDTNGIEYVKLIFDLKSVPNDMIPYAALLSRIIGKLDTQKYSYESLPAEIDMYTGGVYSEIKVYENEYGIRPVLVVNGKALKANIEKLYELFEEIILRNKYDTAKSVLKIIQELKVRYENLISENGHLYSAMRALSYTRKVSAYEDITSGIAFNDFINSADKNIEYTILKLKEVSELIFNYDNVTLSQLYDKCENNNIKLFEDFRNKLPKRENKKHEFVFNKFITKEAITNISKVVYNSKGTDFRLFGFNYSGAMNVVKNIVNTEYLWQNIRVKGGAYGSGCVILRNGSIYMYSYRDPNIVKTFDTYDLTGNFLRDICDDIDINKFIIGAINDIDQPKSNSNIIDIATMRFINGITDDMRQKARDEILSANKKDILLCADIFDTAMKNSALVTIGDENNINKNDKFFKTVRNLNIK